MQPPGRTLRRDLDEFLGGSQSFFPVLFMRVNEPAHFQHVRMMPQHRRDPLQLNLGLRDASQFTPTNGGGKKVRVGRTERLHPPHLIRRVKPAWKQERNSLLKRRLSSGEMLPLRRNLYEPG